MYSPVLVSLARVVALGGKGVRRRERRWWWWWQWQWQWQWVVVVTVLGRDRMYTIPADILIYYTRVSPASRCRTLML